MKIFVVILFNLFIVKCHSWNSCLPCESTLYRSCYNCFNRFPADYIYAEKVNIICNLTYGIFSTDERFHSIIKSYTTRNCITKVLYLDRYTLWKYLESMSITYARLTHLSPVIFNRSVSFSPILFSITTLNFSHNSMRIINTNFSYYFPSLEKLDLSYNRLVFIGKNTFIYLIYLKELYLNNNHLRRILSINFPRQSLNLINLNHNHWHCSCKSVSILSISRPIPTCYTPIHYKNQNASDITRQCFLRAKAVVLITTNIDQELDLICTLSSTVDIWQNKINKNITLLSAWHTERRRFIPTEYLYALSKHNEKYLICFSLNSSQSKSVHTIIPLNSKSPLLNIVKQAQTISMNNTTNQILITNKSEQELPRFFRWLFNTSKNILPKSIQISNRKVLIFWLILLTCVFWILLLLICYIYRQCQTTKTHQVNHLNKNFPDHQTVFDLKINCRNHKCLCQYNHSTMHLTNSTSLNSIVMSNIEFNKNKYHVRSLLNKSIKSRYAKIKRVASANEFNYNYLPGQFRTIIKLKSLPN